MEGTISMRGRSLEVRPGALFALIASVALAGCQPSVNVSNAAVDRRLPPPQSVEIPLVTDENEQPIVPDAVKGKQVFEANCAVCHGMSGTGNGPMSKTLVAPDIDVLTAFLGVFGITLHRTPLPSHPADFTNRDLENVISPAILFETVTEGRPHTAMPAFGAEASFGANKAQTLKNEERWDANAYEMTFRTNPAELSAAKALYDQQCAVCHGANGDGKGPRGPEMAAGLWSWSRGEGPGIFTDINYIAQRNPSELINAILDGQGFGLMPGYRGKLTTAQINGLVDYIFAFFYKHPPIK
ncbi:MAG TPA: cytochrome c [bacterium]|nr:cytochrome c [bacterium]